MDLKNILLGDRSQTQNIGCVCYLYGIKHGKERRKEELW